MRQLTFEGFLKNYVLKLSICNSSSLSKLSKETENNNPRLREPLLLFACFTHNGKTIQRLFRKNENLINDYNQYFKQYKNSEDILNAFEQNENLIPTSYQKVYKSYLSRKNRFLNDNHTKSLMKNKIVNLQMDKKLTDYRLYTDLHLNPGNFNAFMKHDRFDKLSLESTRKLLKHLENSTSNHNLQRHTKTY